MVINNWNINALRKLYNGNNISSSDKDDLHYVLIKIQDLEKQGLKYSAIDAKLSTYEHHVLDKIKTSYRI